MTPYPDIKNQHRKNNMIQKKNNKSKTNRNQKMITQQNKTKIKKTYVRLMCRGFVCCRLCQFVFDGRNHHNFQTQKESMLLFIFYVLK